MTPQNSYESDQENEQFIRSVKPSEFEHHHPRPRVLSKSTTKEASHQCRDGEESALQQSSGAATLLLENTRMPNHEAEGSREDTGRERLKRHRIEVGGRVWIPDRWGKEELLKDWIDCSVFDEAIMNSSIMSARAALIEEGRRAHSRRLKI